MILDRNRKYSTLLALALANPFVVAPTRVQGSPSVRHLADRSDDTVARPTDPGSDTPFDSDAHRLVDLLRMDIGTWAPDFPGTDLFTGTFDANGEFVRLDVTVDGLVNPPGRADPLAFDPFAFGPNPIYGFIEIDIDEDVDTGGEVDTPQFRYLGNVARFGGLPIDENFDNRVALNRNAFDQDFNTPPFVERHGEEFHLAFLGEIVANGSITVIDGDGDSEFEAGETWLLEGEFFHRAHGYEPFSFVQGGQSPGQYAPVCSLRFKHALESRETQISLVFPLTNVGAGLAGNEVPEAHNADPSDQASILEALEDLEESALFLRMFPTGIPEEELIWSWAFQNPSEQLDAEKWGVTALLGTSYTQPDPSGLYFVWTDVFPDVVLGDVDGDGEQEDDDDVLIADFIGLEDGSDGMIDGRVVLADFASDFSVYDINYDGVIDALDMGAMLCAEYPGNGKTLWRSEKNTIRLIFSSDLDPVGAGDLVIREMLDGGGFGQDLASGFESEVEDDDDGRPRILKITDEGDSDLVHRRWYAIGSVDNWAGGGDFVVAYLVEIGDADGDGALLNLDVGFINSVVPDLFANDDDRRDVDGDGTVLNDDVSTTNVQIPSLAVPKPAGH